MSQACVKSARPSDASEKAAVVVAGWKWAHVWLESTARLQRCRWLGMANSNKVVFINIYIYICIHTNTKKEASIDGGNGKTQQMLKTSFPPQKTWSYISEGRVQPSLYTKCISTHTYSMCTCREIKGNIRWQLKMCIDQRISVHPFKQICTLTHMYRHTHWWHSSCVRQAQWQLCNYLINTSLL